MIITALLIGVTDLINVFNYSILNLLSRIYELCPT